MLYYIILAVIYPVSILPFPVLYRLSDVMYVCVHHLIGYRKKVVRANLKSAFPDRTPEELRDIEQKFYRFFCDLIVESVKMLSISESTLKKRMTFSDITVFKRYFEAERSIVVLLGHYGNWELAGARFSVERWHKMFVVYKPPKLAFADRLAVTMRTRFGNGVYTMKSVLRGMLQHRNELTATSFLADQTPSDSRSYRVRFLHQDTTVLLGAAKIAVKLDHPVIYASVRRVKRGHYRIDVHELETEPAHSTAEKITEQFFNHLEQDICAMPETWLWTHKRWKHAEQKLY